MPAGDYASIKLGIIGNCKNPEQCGNKEIMLKYHVHARRALACSIPVPGLPRYAVFNCER